VDAEFGVVEPLGDCGCFGGRLAIVEIERRPVSARARDAVAGSASSSARATHSPICSIAGLLVHIPARTNDSTASRLMISARVVSSGASSAAVSIALQNASPSNFRAFARAIARKIAQRPASSVSSSSARRRSASASSIS
jgi:hypothetical protein